MKFLYRYQNHEGRLAEGEVVAPSQAEAFSLLRKSGVRPMKVWPVPGLANRLSALGKRGWSLIILGILCLTLAVVATVLWAHFAEMRDMKGLSLSPLPRRQLAARDVSVFRFAFERDLVRFAQPGDLSFEQLPAPSLDDMEIALKTPLRADPSDGPDVLALKRVVAGLKQEARVALDCGESPNSILARFVERQRMEAAYRAGVQRELRAAPPASEAAARARLDAANATLRLMGLAEITPDER